MLSTDVAKAVEFARRAHAGQTDKAGAPYMEHLERVAARLEEPALQVIAYLHDTLEDTALTPEALAAVFGPDTAAAVLAMTHRSGESYDAYLQRLRQHPAARQVKISDLIDNSNLARLPVVTLRDVQRQAKYNRALALLLGTA